MFNTNLIYLFRSTVMKQTTSCLAKNILFYVTNDLGVLYSWGADCKNQGCFDYLRICC